MEDVQRTEHRRIWFQEFPPETLGSIDDNHRLETVIQRPTAAMQPCSYIDDEEGRHRQRFIDLDGVPPYAIAEIYRPRQARRHSVGVIRQAGEQATEPADHDPDADRDDERPSGRRADAMCELPQLNGDD